MRITALFLFITPIIELSRYKKITCRKYQKNKLIG